MSRLTIPMLLAALLFSQSVGLAQDQSPTRVPLEELVDRAVKQNEALKASRLEVEGKQFAAQQAKAWRNPELSLVGGRKTTEHLDPLEGEESGLLYEASISQPFYFPGKQSLRGEIGRLEAQATGAETSAMEITLAQEVVRLAYDYEINRRKGVVAQNRQHRFELMQKYLSGRTFAAPQQKAELLVAQARLNALTINVLKSQSNQRSTYDKLAILVGWKDPYSPQGVEVQLPWFRGELKLDLAESLKTAPLQNLTLTKQRALTLAAQKENRLARWEVIPDFSIFGTYAQEEAGDTDRFIKGGLSFELPLLNQNRGGIHSSARRLDAQDALLRYYEQQVRAQLARLHAEYDVAREIVQLFPEEFMNRLQRQIKETESEFRKGRVSLLTFIDLDSELGGLYERSWDAQAALLDKVLEISLLTGDREFVSRLAQY